jgi:hypothetical protein
MRSDKLGDVMNFVKRSSKGSLKNVKFITAFPKRCLEDPFMSMESAGFGKQESLNVDFS